MFNLRKKVSENLVLFALTSFAFMSILGIGMGMEMTNGQMSSCPFTAGQQAICQMNITEHITKWQQAFVGIPTKGDTLALAILLFAVVLISFVKQLFQLEKLTELAGRLFAYCKINLVKVFDPLLIAFSDGILNPRIYELAHI